VLVRVACNGQKGARQVPPHRTEGSTPAVTTNARTRWLRLPDERQAQLAAGLHDAPDKQSMPPWGSGGAAC